MYNSKTCYVGEIEMNVFTRELLLFFLQQEMRERGLLKSNLRKNPMKSRGQCLREFERE